MKTKHPVHIRVFGVVTCDLNVVPQIIFPQGLRLNREAYIAPKGGRVGLDQESSYWQTLHQTTGH